MAGAGTPLCFTVYGGAGLLDCQCCTARNAARPWLFSAKSPMGNQRLRSHIWRLFVAGRSGSRPVWSSPSLHGWARFIRPCLASRWFGSVSVGINQCQSVSRAGCSHRLSCCPVNFDDDFYRRSRAQSSVRHLGGDRRWRLCGRSAAGWDSDG